MFFKSGKDTPVFKICCTACCPASLHKRLQQCSCCTSRFHQLKMADSLIGTGLFLLVTAGMALEPRFFCRFLCPMGAVFSLMPVLPFSVIKRNRENCIPNCKACNLVCPANLEIPSDKEGDNATSGECFSCGKCIGKCPKQNTHNGLPGRLWLPMLVGKAVILFVIFRILY